MAETLELQQVVCPSCKAVLTTFDPFLAEVECPYCHNKAINPLVTAKKMPIPERIIVFKTTEDDFERAMVNNLVERDYVPTDIFQCINTDDIIKAYLPMFLYEGTYKSSWSCKVAVESTELAVSASGDKLKNKKVKKFLPHTGTSQGNFSFLCLAHEGKDAPEELREFCKQYFYNVMGSKEYNPDLTKDPSGKQIHTFLLDTDTDITWSKYGDGLVSEIARENALEQLSGDEIRDFRASNSYDLKHNGRLVLAPLWFVYYTYNNEKHYFMMDGLGEDSAMSTPVDAEDAKFVSGKETIKKIVDWLWPIVFVVWYFTNFGTAVAYLAIWFAAKYIVRFIMNRQINARLNSSREKRRQAAQNL